MFCVISTVVAEPGKELDVAKILVEHVQNKKNEPLTHVIHAYRSHSDSRRFIVYLEFETEAGMDAHRATKNYTEDIITRLYGMSVVDDFLSETYDSLD